MESILNSIKKMLGLDAVQTIFDPDIIAHINSALMVLNDLGVGTDGFMIFDEKDLWTDFLPDMSKFGAVQTFVYLKVKLLFDPPPTSFIVTAVENNIKELSWRLANKKKEEVIPSA